MKKILIAVVILLIALPAYGQVELARLSPAMMGSVVATCTAGGPTEVAIIDRTDVGTASSCAISGADYRAYLILRLGASSYTITRFVLYAKDSEQGGSLVGQLYASSGSTPNETIGSAIAGSSASVSHTEVSDHPTFSDATMTLSTPLAGVTGTVWVGFSPSATSGVWFGTYWNDSDTGQRMWYNDVAYRSNASITAAVYGCLE